MVYKMEIDSFALGSQICFNGLTQYSSCTGNKGGYCGVIQMLHGVDFELLYSFDQKLLECFFCHVIKCLYSYTKYSNFLVQILGNAESGTTSLLGF